MYVKKLTSFCQIPKRCTQKKVGSFLLLVGVEGGLYDGELLLMCCSERLDDLYAFHYTASDITLRHVGWNLYDIQSEYLRMGVPNDHWILSHINKDYEVRAVHSFPR